MSEGLDTSVCPVPDALRKPLPQLQVQGGASTVWPHPVFCLELLFLLNPTPPSPWCFSGLVLGGLGRMILQGWATFPGWLSECAFKALTGYQANLRCL